MTASSQSRDRGSVGAERVAAWLLVVLAIAFALAVATGPGASVATDSPTASFAGTYDASANSLTVEHADGDAVRAGTTSALVLVIDDTGTDNVANVTWVADDGDGSTFPVEPGETITVDDAFVDANDDGDRFDADATVGFELDEGDDVRVVWRGRPLGAPSEITRTLDRMTVERDG